MAKHLPLFAFAAFVIALLATTIALGGLVFRTFRSARADRRCRHNPPVTFNHSVLGILHSEYIGQWATTVDSPLGPFPICLTGTESRPSEADALLVARLLPQLPAIVESAIAFVREADSTVPAFSLEPYTLLCKADSNPSYTLELVSEKDPECVWGVRFENGKPCDFYNDH